MRGKKVSFKQDRDGRTIIVFWRAKTVRGGAIFVDCFSREEGFFGAQIEYLRGLKPSHDEAEIKAIREYVIIID